MPSPFTGIFSTPGLVTSCVGLQPEEAEGTGGVTDDAVVPLPQEV